MKPPKTPPLVVPDPADMSVVFTFKDGSTAALPAIEAENRAHLQYIKMASSADPQLRAEGKQALARVAAATLAARLKPELDAAYDLAVAEELSQRNRAVATAPRPDRRTINRDEVIAEFRRLRREGHSAREARGLLTQRGVASQSSVYRLTKGIEEN